MRELNCSVVFDSLWPIILQPTRLLCPWDSPGKNTGVEGHFLFQWIFLTQGLNLHLLHWQVDSLAPVPPGGSDSKGSACNVGDNLGSGICLRSKWQDTPVFLPGEFHGQRSLADYSPWGCRVGRHWAINTQCHLRSPHKLVYLPITTTLGIYFSYFSLS